MSSHSVSLIAPNELSIQQTAAWQEIIDQSQTFCSPYFSPYFSKCIGKARQDVQIAVWRHGNDYVGFLPFHRRPMNTGKPISGPMSDYHAVIARDEFRPSARQILQDCQLDVFDFQNWLATELPQQAHVSETGIAPYMDLSAGFDAYEQARRQAGISELKKTAKKMRKLQREIGPLRLEAESDDPRLLQAMYAWKGNQYLRTGEFNAFELPWIRQALEAINTTRTSDFRGALSGLYAGDELLSVHLGMRTNKVWHYWFPTHNPAFARYSPGMILALETARYAAERGVDRIELGKGNTRFKQALGSDAIELQSGYLGDRNLPSGVRKLRYALETGSEKLPIGSVSTWPRRLFKRLERRFDRQY